MKNTVFKPLQPVIYMKKPKRNMKLIALTSMFF